MKSNIPDYETINRVMNTVLAVARGEQNHVHVPDLSSVMDQWVSDTCIPEYIPTRKTCEHYYRKSVTKRGTTESGVVTYMVFKDGSTMLCSPALKIRKVNGSTTRSTEHHHFVIPSNVVSICSYEITLTPADDVGGFKFQSTKHVYTL